MFYSQVMFVTFSLVFVEGFCMRAYYSNHKTERKMTIKKLFHFYCKNVNKIDNNHPI